MAQHGEEFECTECGRLIIALPYDFSKMHICAACISIPRWWEIPEIAKAIDPDCERKIPNHEI